VFDHFAQVHEEDVISQALGLSQDVGYHHHESDRFKVGK
jgi:hypothetical protein